VTPDSPIRLGKRSIIDYIDRDLVYMLTNTGQDSSEIVRDDSVAHPLTEEPDELYHRADRSIQYDGNRSDKTGTVLTTMMSNRCRFPRLLKKLM
jgi:hypothetical protein